MAKILIVDDEAGIRIFCHTILSREGHKVECAASAGQAFSLYRKSPADVVLVDVLMRKWNGVDLVPSMARKFPQIRIIAIAGGWMWDADIFLARAIAAGAVDALCRPFTAEQLVACTDNVLMQVYAAD